MSPHGIAGPQNQISPNSGKKCPLASPLTVQNFVAIRRELSEISAIKNLCFPKNRPKFTKIAIDLLPHESPLIPYFIEIGETPWRKRYHFLHPKVTGLGGGVHQPPIAKCKISSRSDDPSPDICCQTSSILFVAHKKSHKTYSKRYVATLHAATTIFCEVPMNRSHTAILPIRLYL